MSEPDEIHAIPKDELDLQRYWKVTVAGQAWQMSLNYLLRQYREQADSFLIGVKEDGAICYFLNRAVFTPAIMAKWTGIAEDKFTEVVHTIDLPALEKADRPDQPKPTVSYWGEA